MPAQWPASRRPNYGDGRRIRGNTGSREMFTFVRNLVGVKTDQVVNNAVEALVRWDPQSATEAELRTMEQHLDDLGRQVATARQSYDKEQKEAEAIQAL